MFSRLSQLLNEMQRELNSVSHMVEGTYTPTPATLSITPLANDMFAPISFPSSMVPMDMTSTDKGYEITMDVPGLTGSGISVTIEPGNILTVVGNRSCNKAVMKDSESGEKVYAERFQGKFSRSVKLPDDIDTRNVDASVHNGILLIHIGRKLE